MQRFLISALLVSFIFQAFAAPLKYVGVNEAGAEFGAGKMPGVMDTDYTYPKTASIDYFIAKGMNSIRVCFRWERMQRTFNSDFHPAELEALTTTVDYITKTKGAYAVLDVHNYARYMNNIIGGSEVPDSAFADFWKRLALVFKNNDKVIFGLMNEPHDLPTDQWVRSANAAIAAIRETGAGHLILVCGSAYSGAHSWTKDYYGISNGVALKSIVDPMHNWAIEVHQYFDGDSSGTNVECMSTTIGEERLRDVTAWCKENNITAYLGEFGSGATQTCGTTINGMLKYMEDNSDVWIGWAWWAAGPWWDNYILSIEPTPAGADRPQLSYLLPYLRQPAKRNLGVKVF